MSACWHESLYQQILKHICGDDFNPKGLKEVIDCTQQGYEGATSVINYISCHDHQYTLTELGDRNIFEESAFKRAKLGAVLCNCSPQQNSFIENRMNGECSLFTALKS